MAHFQSGEANLKKQQQKNRLHHLSKRYPDGRLEIDNNCVERSIKPFVIWHKNWLFHHNAKGAKAGAILFLLIETFKQHNVDVFAWLKYVLSNFQRADSVEKLEQLLSFNVTETPLEQSRAMPELIFSGLVHTDASIYMGHPSFDGALLGVTRSILLKELSHDFPVIERSITPDELLNAEEVFLTNALMGIQQVRQVNDKLYPARAIGSAVYSKLKELMAYI